MGSAREHKRTKTRRNTLWTQGGESEKSEGRRDKVKCVKAVGLYFMGNGSLNIFICTFFTVPYCYICYRTCLLIYLQTSISLLDSALNPQERDPPISPLP